MASNDYRTLQVRIIAAILCFSILPLLALGLVIHYQYDTAYDNKLMETAKALAANRRSSVELFLMDKVAQLKTLADTLSPEQTSDNGYLDRLFRAMRSNSPYLIDIGVIDREGKYVNYAGPHVDEMKLVSCADTEWFHTTMVSNAYISDVFRGIGKIPQIALAVTSSDRSHKYILRATLNSDVLTTIVQQGQVSRKSDAFIVNRQNILQTEPRSSGTILNAPIAPDLSSRPGTNVEKIDFKGDETLFATNEMANPKWVVVVREDTQEELNPLYVARHTVILTLISGSLLIFIGALYTGRTITKKLVQVEHRRALSDDIAMHSGKMAALGKMAAGIAHEINNPLAIIGETAGWMEDVLKKEDTTNNPNLRECADCIGKIERQVERSRKIVHRLLGFARRVDTIHEMTDVNSLLSETITFLGNAAYHKNINIEPHFDERLPQITTDAAQLQQVFLNVMNNAIDAIRKSGNISIRTSQRSDGIRVEIEDDGPGIPSDIVEKIFDPFFTTKGVGAGTGLGLSISYSIIEKLKGKIIVASQEGKGTVFTIDLPMS